jgi:site-specific DNA-cytosine methylase
MPIKVSFDRLSTIPVFFCFLLVTYFVTYGTAVACYAYFVLTKQEYLYPDARDRQYLISFHKKAKKQDWNVEKYNQLKEGVVKVENELKRLKDPLRLKLPIEKLEGIKARGSGVLGSQVNIGNIKEMLKGKFGSSS